METSPQNHTAEENVPLILHHFDTADQTIITTQATTCFNLVENDPTKTTQLTETRIEEKTRRLSQNRPIYKSTSTMAARKRSHYHT